MSGCVNCVWDTYREEVEEWAAGRRKREANLKGPDSKISREPGLDDDRSLHEGDSISDLDGVGGAGSYEGVNLDDERGLFEGVPVGIKEFMKQEKRIRERKAKIEA